jgi:hypothetical protein
LVESPGAKGGEKARVHLATGHKTVLQAEDMIRTVIYG